MEKNKEKLLAIMEKFLGQEFTLLLPENKSCKYKIDWLTTTQMTSDGKLQDSVKCAVTITDGFVMKTQNYMSFLSVDTYLGLSKDFEVIIDRSREGYHMMFVALGNHIATKTKIFGYTKVFVDRIKLAR